LFLGEDEMTESKMIGQNITAKQEGDKLILEIDLSKEIGLSSTGKMMGIASTGGFVPLFNMTKEFKVNLYLGERVR
jgi:hypothetical protein